MIANYGSSFIPDFGDATGDIKGMFSTEETGWKNLLDYCCNKPQSELTMKVIKQQRIINEIKEHIEANPNRNFILNNMQAL